MKKERAMAIFIGVIMILSMVGFGLSSTRLADTQQNTIDVPFIVNRELTGEEIVSVLRTGRVVVEDVYEANCTSCLETNQILQTFFQPFNRYAVLQISEGNQTSLKMIGASGRIKDLSGIRLNDTALMDAFCELAILQPKECLLEQI